MARNIYLFLCLTFIFFYTILVLQDGKTSVPVNSTRNKTFFLEPGYEILPLVKNLSSPTAFCLDENNTITFAELEKKTGRKFLSRLTAYHNGRLKIIARNIPGIITNLLAKGPEYYCRTRDGHNYYRITADAKIFPVQFDEWSKIASILKQHHSQHKQFGYPGHTFHLELTRDKTSKGFSIYRFDPALKTYYYFYKKTGADSLSGPVTPVAMMFDNPGKSLLILDLGGELKSLEQPGILPGALWCIRKKDRSHPFWWSWSNKLIIMIAILIILGLTFQFFKAGTYCSY